MKKKRVVFISDLHCGHRVGLTPPQYHNGTKGKQYQQIQKEIWDWYKGQLKALQPIDILMVVGDCVDGPGKRSGGTELIQPMIAVQIDMAVECIAEANAGSVVMVYGTPYHVGEEGLDAEDYVAEKAKAKIHDHAKYRVNDTVFSVKHKIGSSTIPHGKGTPIAKERLWDFLWTEWDDSEKADVLIRGHVHYAFMTGEPTLWMGLTMPALQGLGSKYGARQCSGVVHVGMYHFDCYEGGGYHWEPHIAQLSSQKRKVYEL